VRSWPRSILADSGFLIAFFVKRDAAHPRAVEFAAQCRSQLVTVWPVLTETAHFLSQPAKRAMIELVMRGGIVVAEIHAAELKRMGDLLGKYPTMDFADAALVCAADALHLADVATLDERDFSVYRTKAGKPFRNWL
jgi:predicted nucleic acid-binding protein